MKELSLHIIDVMENGISAGANLIELRITESQKDDLLTIRIRDNGKGIPQNEIKNVLDPFYTTRTTRRVGLGLSLFREASLRCEGDFHIESKEGKGTEVTATFKLNHLDLAPLGDIASSIGTMIMGNSEMDFLYEHEIDKKSFVIDTRDIRKELDGVPLNNIHVVKLIMNNIKESLEEMR